MHCSVIGDIKGSKKIVNREEVQNKFINVLNDINKEYANNIDSKFMIVQGDEFQGLLNNPENLLEILQKIKLAILPAKMRVGIGMGGLNTKIYINNISNVDGSAFNNARDSINELTINEGKYENIIQNIYIKVESELLHGKLFKEYVNLINVSLLSCTLIESNWTEKQVEVIKLKSKNLTQRQIAKKIAKSQPAVQKRLNVSGYFTYIYCINNIQDNINIFWRIFCDK